MLNIQRSNYNKIMNYIVIRQSISSLADNFSTPYIGYYLAYITPSGITQGVLQFSTNALPTLVQVFVGPIVDRFKKYIMLLLASSIFASLIWLIVPVVSEPLAITSLITLRAIFIGLSGLAFTAFIGFIFSDIDRGKVLSKVNTVSQLTALISFIVTALVVNPSIDVLKLLFIFSGLVSLAASFLWISMLYLDKQIDRNNNSLNLFSILKIISSNKSFIKFSSAYFAQIMAMALAWPWFPLVQKYILNMSVAQVAIMNICASISTVITQYLLTNYIHKIDIKKMIIVSRLGFVMLPLFYGIAYNSIHLYIAHLILGPFTALSNVLIPLYIFKVSTHGMYASYMAATNFSQGMAASIGSIIGGIIADIFIGLYGYIGLRYILLVDVIIRLIATLFFIKIDKV